MHETVNMRIRLSLFVSVSTDTTSYIDTFSNRVDILVCTVTFINTKSSQTRVIHKVDHLYKNMGGMNISHYPAVGDCDQAELPTA